MKYKAILFDMDGTLVPLYNDTFTKGYFKLLYARLSKYGLDAQNFAKNMWTAVGDMVKNDGTMSNEDAFWKKFEVLTGIEKATIADECLDFYGGEFDQAKAFTEENPLAVEAIRLAHAKAEKVVLATNPLFPAAGQKTRMNWVGLTYADFDLVTSYEEERFCKPNPNYYREICKRMGVAPEECLMIGNDEMEDMAAASSLGMDCYLVTNWMIPCEAKPWEGGRGTFSEMVEMLRNLE